MGTIEVVLRDHASRRPRVLTLPRLEKDGEYAAIAVLGRDRADLEFFADLLADPEVRVRDGHLDRTLRVREVVGEPAQDWVREALRAYGGSGEGYPRTGRDVRVFVLAPCRPLANGQDSARATLSAHSATSATDEVVLARLPDPEAAAASGDPAPPLPEVPPPASALLDETLVEEIAGELTDLGNEPPGGNAPTGRHAAPESGRHAGPSAEGDGGLDLFGPRIEFPVLRLSRAAEPTSPDWIGPWPDPGLTVTAPPGDVA